LAAPLYTDITTVMNIGIVVGALAAALLAGKFAPKWNIPLRSLVAAVLGGVLLGYGARLAFGCNIGAYFGGISSGSLHGWLWLVMAFI
ncbi:YeeE/YedE thiosulfate transporter family protein, partial [Pseudoalteromonas sp. SIMBA_148]